MVKRIVVLLAYLLAGTGWTTYASAGAPVLIITPPYSPVAHELRQFLEELGAQAYDFVLVNHEELHALRQKHQLLQKARIITLGEEAFTRTLGTLDHIPVLSLFIRRDQYQSHLSKRTPSTRQISAVYLESPLERQLNLISILMPQAQTVAVLSSAPDMDLDIRHRIRIQPFMVDPPQKLPRILPRALSTTDAILATADPKIYNRNQIKLILLSAYRHNRPVFGPSLAFVRAGSLATTFSSIGDFSREVIEALEFHDKHGYWPKPGYSRYFSVAVNRQVARSMGMSPPSDEVLQHELERMEHKP